MWATEFLFIWDQTHWHECECVKQKHQLPLLSVDSLLLLLLLLTQSHADIIHATTVPVWTSSVSEIPPTSGIQRLVYGCDNTAIWKRTEGPVALNLSFPALPETNITKMSGALCIVGSLFGEWCAPICVLIVNDRSNGTIVTVIIIWLYLTLSGSAEGQPGI